MDNDDRQDGGAVAFDVLHQLAELLANSGEGVVFVESELRRATGALGSDLELLALPEQLVHATPGIARLDRVSAAHEVVDSLEHGLPAAAARARLEAIAVAPPPLGGRARVLGVALFAGGFAPSVVATASEAAAAVLTGVAFAIRPGIVDLAGPVLVVLPALFVVLPGVRLSAGTGELLAGRITSGTGRVVWSFFILAQMVVGVVGAGAGATALTEQEVPPNCPSSSCSWRGSLSEPATPSCSGRGAPTSDGSWPASSARSSWSRRSRGRPVTSRAPWWRVPCSARS